MRRRTKPRVVWLPPTNANSVPENAASGIQFFVLDLTTNSPGQVVVGEIPLTIDAQSDPLDPNTSLADVESSGYRLRRIVGKVWVANEADQESGIEAVVVTAGIMVRRADAVTGVSYALSTGLVDAVAPSDIENYGDPWVWRRSWLLNGMDGVNTGFQGALASDNMFFSALDGPHVDQKTARVIGPEERLFLDVSAQVVLGTGQSDLTHAIRVYTDLRVLASMRTSAGNRRNASR